MEKRIYSRQVAKFGTFFFTFASLREIFQLSVAALPR
jgi:hypothetical protein